jgi:aminopeptidase
MTEQELRRYAAVILEVGVALQPGQDLAVNAHLAHADFARVLCDEAYRRGAALVDLWYWDAHSKLARLEHAPTDTLSRTPEWLDERYRALASRRGALINLTGDPDPGLLRNVNPARAGLDRMPALASRFEVQSRNEVQWCFAAVPSEGWARQVFGEPDVLRLWKELAVVMRLGTDDPVQAWWRRMDELNARCQALDDQRFDSLHYLGAGTDMEIGLPARHRSGRHGPGQQTARARWNAGRGSRASLLRRTHHQRPRPPRRRRRTRTVRPRRRRQPPRRGRACRRHLPPPALGHSLLRHAPR